MFTIKAPDGQFTYKVLGVSKPQMSTTKSERAEGKQERQTDQAATHYGIGSNTFSYLARDNGKFGSIASHDDYGDKSNAESHDNDWSDINYE